MLHTHMSTKVRQKVSTYIHQSGFHKMGRFSIILETFQSFLILQFQIVPRISLCFHTLCSHCVCVKCEILFFLEFIQSLSVSTFTLDFIILVYGFHSSNGFFFIWYFEFLFIFANMYVYIFFYQWVPIFFSSKIIFNIY